MQRNQTSSVGETEQCDGSVVTENHIWCHVWGCGLQTASEKASRKIQISEQREFAWKQLSSSLSQTLGLWDCNNAISNQIFLFHWRKTALSMWGEKSGRGPHFRKFSTLLPFKYYFFFSPSNIISFPFLNWSLFINKLEFFILSFIFKNFLFIFSTFLFLCIKVCYVLRYIFLWLVSSSAVFILQFNRCMEFYFNGWISVWYFSISLFFLM